MCVCFERNFLAMGNSLEDFWSINKKYMHGFSREEDEEFIRQYKKVLIVMSKDFLTDLKSLYYMDVLKSLKNKGAVSIMAMIDIDGCTVSYRTVKEDIDLGKDVASLFGGGGHPKAAGSEFSQSIKLKVVEEIFG